MFCNMNMVYFSLFAVLLVKILSLNSFSIIDFCTFGLFFLNLLKKESVKLKKISSKNMENKIQELTDKIYREGVEKGNEEAQRLISSARDEAAKIVEDARKEAESILAVARKSAKETAENTQSEIKLFAGQAVNALKTEIATLLTNEVVSESVKGFVADKEYLNKFIVSLAAQWSANESIVISTADAEGLKKYFAANAKALLDKGVRIEEVNGTKSLFTISPADGSYKVNFGEEEFENYFKDFLRPQLVEMLF